MGLTTAGRDHNADLTAAYNHISEHPGSDVHDIAGVLGCGTRLAREVIATLAHADLITEKADLNTFEVANSTDDVIAWIQAYGKSEPEPKSAVRPQGSNPACKCGCGAPTNHPRSLFRPGHDARMAGNVARAIAAGGDAAALLATLPSDALKQKAFDHAARLASKGAPATAPVEPTITHEWSEKVGRWTYPAREWSNGTRERNTKRNGSGEWVAV